MANVNMIHPSFVQSALNHVGVENVTVEDNGGGGFTITARDDSFTVQTLLNKLAGVALEKYVMDTMVLPSNANTLMDCLHDLCSYMEWGTIDAETREMLDETTQSIRSVIDNLKATR